MNSEHTLSLAFMGSHPAQAAQVLESLPSDEASRLFAEAPARLAANVLACMLPYMASNCLDSLADERVLELLSAMGTQPSVAVLRHVAEPRRGRLISGLPTATAVASSLLLGYGEDSIGAWTELNAVMLPSDTSVAQALDHLRQADDSDAAIVYVVDDKQKLVGQVKVGQLLKAQDQVALAALMREVPQVLIAVAPLAGAAAHPGWEESSVLPVVERDMRLLGTLSRMTLAHVLRKASSEPMSSAEEVSVSVLLARSYWHAISGLLEGGLMLLPKVRPLDKASHVD